MRIEKCALGKNLMYAKISLNDRDFAAAVNILNEGLRLLRQEGSDLRSRVGISRCLSQWRLPLGESIKQESHQL